MPCKLCLMFIVEGSIHFGVSLDMLPSYRHHKYKLTLVQMSQSVVTTESPPKHVLRAGDSVID